MNSCADVQIVASGTIFDHTMIIPGSLRASCAADPRRREWIEQLPSVVGELAARWRLALRDPFDGDDASCSWVAPAQREDGETVVLKVGMPHLEGEHELHGLRFWTGDPTVRLLDGDEALNAMLLEHCEPGTSLRSLPEWEQDEVIASLLRRLWRAPAGPHPFRPLSAMTDLWREETIAQRARWPDHTLVMEGLRLLDELPRRAGAGREVLLATDLHAGNVLRSRREPWLVIDPKPFIGDPAYDATQHLLNCPERLRMMPLETIARLAGLLDVDPERVRLWIFARIAAEPRGDWSAASVALARTLALRSFTPS